MQKIYLSIVKKRDHFVFVILISISFSFLLNNDSTNTLLIRAKFLDSFSFITKPSMWIKSVSQLEEETQLLREKNLQLTLQSDAMIDAYNEIIRERNKKADGGEVSLTVIEIPDISGAGVETLFKKR